MLLTVIKVHHFFVLKAQYPSRQNSYFDDISPYHNGRSHTKIILFFFSCDFTIFTGDVNTYYIDCLSFPGSQVKFN